MAGFLSLFVTWLPGALIAFLTERAQRSTWLARQAHWDAGNHRLRKSYHCARDDVIVESGRTFRPEYFIGVLFGGPQPRT
jgi:hypothetical protein